MSSVVSDRVRQAHPDASTIFVLGVLAFVVFPLGFAAWHFGGRLLAKYDAEPGRWDSRRWVEVGRILGVVGLAVTAGEVLIYALTV